MKIIVIFEGPEIDHSEYQNFGVQRSLFLAIVEEIPESRCNMRSILELLNLDEMNYYLI